MFFLLFRYSDVFNFLFSFTPIVLNKPLFMFDLFKTIYTLELFSKINFTIIFELLLTSEDSICGLGFTEVFECLFRTS